MRFLLAFGLISLAEMATFFWVESRIGLLPALGIAIGTAIIGSFLVRRAGLSVLARIREKVNQGRVPGRELSDGAAVLVSGAFLISPGFLTDIAGFLLLFPPIQGLIYRSVSSRISARVTTFTTFQSGEVIDVDPIDPDPPSGLDDTDRYLGEGD